MIAKFAALAAMAAAPVLVSATESGIAPSQHPEVVRVQCLVGMGSAFRVGPKTLLSVAHVTGLGGCFIDGEPIHVVQTQGDFTILSTDRAAPNWLRIDCGGFISGRRYTAIGYARGLPTQTTVDMTATGETESGFYRLNGVFNVIPGQSGGPVVDGVTGEVVGTVNVYNAARGDSGSIPLADTPVCKK